LLDDVLGSIVLFGLDRFTLVWISITLAVGVTTFVWFHVPLYRLKRHIEKFLGQEHEASITSLKELLSLEPPFEGMPPLSSAWELYIRVARQADWSDGIPNPVPFFTQERLIDVPAQRRLAEAVPGFLTAIGILGTFVGLSVGLSQISPENLGTPEGLRRSVVPLLDGMRLAFFSSIVGILSSILWSAADRLHLRMAQAKLAALHDRLDAIFPPVLETELLQEMVRHQREQLGNLKSFLSDYLIPQMVSGFQDAISQTLVPEVNRTLEVMEGIGRSVGEKQLEGVAEMVDTFIESLNESLDDQMRELAQVLRETVEWQRTVKLELSDLLQAIQEAGEAQQQALQAAHQLLVQIGEASEAFIHQKERLAEGTRALEGVLERLVAANDQTQRSLELADQVETRLSALRDQLVQETSKQFQEMRALWDETRQDLAGVVEDIQEVLEDLPTISQQVVEHTREITGRINDELEAFYQKMHGGLEQTFNAFDEHLARATETLGGVVEDMREVLEDLPAISKQIARQTEEISSQMASTAAAVQDAATDLSGGLEQAQEQAVEVLSELGRSLATLTQHLEGFPQLLGYIHDQFRSLTAGMEAVAAELQTVREIVGDLQRQSEVAD